MTITNRLPRSTPEAQGIPSTAITDFLAAADTSIHHLHSFMLVRHGHVVAEGWWAPYAAEFPHVLFSLSKSFTSSAVGMAVAEGRLSIDDPVISFFPDDLPDTVSENLAAMRVRQLLSMSTGHQDDTTGRLHEREDGDWVKAFLSLPVEHKPGTHFVYNSGASYMLSAIVQKLTGVTLLEYLRPRLFEPLGIRGATWESCPRGINTGGWGLTITTEDIACFGQMYLQQGMWQGRRILPEAWIAEASARQVSNGSNPESDWEQGYGYQFWRCRHDIYRGDGAFGQFCVVMPAQDAVVAITAGTEDMQGVLNVVWQHLLPALGPAPLPEDRAAQRRLAQQLAGLAIPPAQGAASSPAAAQVSGVRYAFEKNDQEVEALAFDFDDGDSRGGCRVILQIAGHENVFACGSGAWSQSTTIRDRGELRRMVASGAWTGDDTFAMKLCLYETPFCPTIICRFVDDAVHYDFVTNVSFGPKELAQLVGRRT